MNVMTCLLASIRSFGLEALRKFVQVAGLSFVVMGGGQAVAQAAGPDLTVGPLTIGTIVANQNGSWTIPVTYTVTNTGTVAAPNNWWDLGYLSSNGVLDNSSQSNGYVTQRAVPLAPGASYTATGNFTTTTTTAPGNYTFFVKADGHSSSIGNGTNTDGEIGRAHV